MTYAAVKSFMALWRFDIWLRADSTQVEK